MDCQKDFGLKEYVSHTQCISEQEKYAGVGWKAPTNFNKGEKKQKAWVDTINDTLKKAGNNLSAPCKNLLQAISKHDNVPRKKPKFCNFIRNVAKNRFDEKTIENVWKLLEEQWQSQVPSLKQNNNKGVKIEEESKNENDAETNGSSINHEEKVEDDSKKLSKRDKKEARKRQKEEKKEKNKIVEDVEEDNCQEWKKKSQKEKARRKRCRRG